MEILLILLVLGLGVALFLLTLNRTELLNVIKTKEETVDAHLRKLIELEKDYHNSIVLLQETNSNLEKISVELEAERAKSGEILSQKKSSETRLGQVTEHIVPFLENCEHDPRDMHFLGMPIDYIVFDFSKGEIIFLEVKTGNSKESKRQKMVKNIVKSGKVFYETMRIDTKGVTVKKTENNLYETL